MTDNTDLDAAIEAAGDAIQGKGWSPRSRTYARALIAKLLEGMEKPDWFGVDENYWSGRDAALTEIRRRAGLEVEL
jgi:hypothetical protein